MEASEVHYHYYYKVLKRVQATCVFTKRVHFETYTIAAV